MLIISPNCKIFLISFNAVIGMKNWFFDFLENLLATVSAHSCIPLTQVKLSGIWLEVHYVALWQKRDIDVFANRPRDSVCQRLEYFFMFWITKNNVTFYKAATSYLLMAQGNERYIWPFSNLAKFLVCVLDNGSQTSSIDQVIVSKGYFDKTNGTSITSGSFVWHEYEKQALIGSRSSKGLDDVIGSQSPNWTDEMF